MSHPVRGAKYVDAVSGERHGVTVNRWAGFNWCVRQGFEAIVRWSGGIDELSGNEAYRPDLHDRPFEKATLIGSNEGRVSGLGFMPISWILDYGSWGSG